jgi:hypothetical protein
VGAYRKALRGRGACSLAGDQFPLTNYAPLGTQRAGPENDRVDIKCHQTFCAHKIFLTKLPRIAQMTHDAFRKGYLDGWRSIKGPDQTPGVPARGSITLGEAPYRAGVALGIRDASYSTNSDCPTTLEGWIERALRRSIPRVGGK